MKKRHSLIILLVMVSCVGWFALAKLKESQAPVAGWVHYGTTGETDPFFEFWLPTYYESLNPAVVTLLVRNAANDFGSQYSSVFDDVKIVFAARDTRTDDSQLDILVSYSVSSPRSKIPELALEEIKSRIENQPRARLIDSEIRLLNDYKTIFLVSEMNFEEVKTRQIQYMIFDGNTQWSVLYMPNQDRYDEEVSTFEQSIQTFNTKK